MPLNPLEITGGLAIGEGVGGAIADVVTPRLQQFKNDQWSKHQHKPLDAGTAAEVAAEEVDLYATMETQASYSGYEADRFADLYRVTLTAPGVGTLIELLRRNGEEPINFEHGLRKAKLGNQWDAPLRNLRDVRIPAADLAYMVVRDLVPDPFGFSGPTSAADTAINDIPQLVIDTLAEAAKTGWDEKRFEALVGRSGLAPAPVTAANAFFRGYADYLQYKTMIAKGDLRPAYANVILNTARQILTSGEYAELQLRGYYDRATRLTHTRKHGMSDADSDLLYDVQGRGVNVHQVLIGERRGGAFEGPIDTIPKAYLFALQRGNLRPEVYNLAYAARETYPSYFVTRALLQAKVITPERGKQLFDGLGWPQDVADAAAAFFGGGVGGKADPHVVKAENQLWSRAHAAYLTGDADAAQVTAILPLAGVAAAAIPEVLVKWDAERSITRKELTPAQLKKAYREGIVNPATGTAFTKDEVVAELVTRGFSASDATVFVET